MLIHLLETILSDLLELLISIEIELLYLVVQKIVKLKLLKSKLRETLLRKLEDHSNKFTLSLKSHVVKSKLENAV